MAIDSLYRDYFQKSKVFLYPLLGIKRGSVAAPDQTYVSWGSNIGTEDIKLICSYTRRTDREYLSFENTILFKHKRLSDYKILDEETLILIFDFQDMSSDWFNFLLGKYSKLNRDTKHKILNHFEQNSGNRMYLETYLFPEKYFAIYAELLQAQETLLKEVGELCTPPDLEKENLTVSITNLENSKILG